MVVILMGVTGSGKTTVGELLSQELGWQFCDADRLHPAQNVDKMRQGIPLTDADRVVWLETLRDVIRNYLKANEHAVIACSALKAMYREYLIVDKAVKLVYLKGDFQLIEKRLAERRGHFMNPALLPSQFDALEEPKDAVVVDITPNPEVIVSAIRSQLAL